MPEIAFEEHSPMSQADLAYQIEAVNIQIREHWAPAYMEAPWPCNSYKSLQGLPAGSFCPIAILSDIGTPGAYGWHDFLLGLSYGRCMFSADPLDATTPSHEALELVADPMCNIWLPLPDGRKVAREIADPCQNDSYVIPVTIGTETREIRVSNFTFPSWFVPGAQAPFDYMGTIDEPFGLSRAAGGWRLIQEKDGKITSDFGRHERNHHAMAARAVDTLSRTYRRGFRG